MDSNISFCVDSYSVSSSSVRRSRLLILSVVALVVLGCEVYCASLLKGLLASVAVLGSSLVMLLFFRGFLSFARFFRSSNESRFAYLAKKLVLMVWKTIHDAMYCSYTVRRMYAHGSREGTSGKDLSYFKAYGIATDDVHHVSQVWS